MSKPWWKRRHALALMTLLFLLALLALGTSAVRVLALTPTPLPPAQEQAVMGLGLSVVPEGIRVAVVRPGGPAQAAGIQVGDLLLALDDQELTDITQVQTFLETKRPGDRITVTLRRGSDVLNVTLQLGAPPPTPTFAPTPTPLRLLPTPLIPVSPTPAILGVTINAPAYGLTVRVEGTRLRITRLVSAGIAQRAGLRLDDLITNVNGLNIDTRNLATITGWLTSGSQRLLITAGRGTQTLRVILSPVIVVEPTPRITPTPTVLPVRPDERVQLGVVYNVVTEGLARSRGLRVDYGALVVQVLPGSPAQVAGIRVNDVILAVDGDKVDAKRTLALRMLPYTTGDTVTLTVQRGSQQLEIRVTLVNLRGVALRVGR